jgi:hypothetical protein
VEGVDIAQFIKIELDPIKEAMIKVAKKSVEK